MSPRSVSDLERGINRTARKDTALLLADALELAGPARELFIAVARGQAPSPQLLAAARATFAAGTAPGLARGGGSVTAGQGELAWLLGAVTDSPYRGLAAFEEQDAAFFFGREAATTHVLDRMSRCLTGAGLLVVSGVSGAGKSSLLRAGVLPRIREMGWRPRRGQRRGHAWCSPRPGLRWMNWRCGWRCWREPMRPQYGGDWRPILRGLPSPRGRPP